MRERHDGAQAGSTAGGVNRRDFLSMAGAAGAVVAFPTILTKRLPNAAQIAAGEAKVKAGNLSVFISKDTSYPTQQAQGMAALQQLFQQKFPGSSFTWDTYASSGEELTKLETSAAAHQGPDIFEFGSTLIPTGYASNAFEVITDSMWKELGGKSAFIEAQLTMSGPKPNKLIAVPKTANPYAMVYNTKLFQQAGISKPPTTWTQFVDAAKEMTGGGNYGAAVDFQDTFDPWHYVWLFSTDLGGNMISKDGKKAQLNSKEVVEAATFWLDWVAKYKIANKLDATFKGADMTKAFAAGTVGMIPLAGPGGIKSYDASAVAGSYAWGPNPTVPYGMKSMPKGGKPAQGFVSGQYWSVFKYSQNKQLAFELVKLMTSPEIQYQFFKQDAQVPVTWATFSKYPDTKKSPWDIFVPAEQKSYPTAFNGGWGQLEVAIGDAINKMATQIALNGTYAHSDLVAALQQANQQLQANLAQQPAG